MIFYHKIRTIIGTVLRSNVSRGDARRWQQNDDLQRSIQVLPGNVSCSG
ncbi:hypothetical protein Z949_1108 [Sulfitobacter guttiformis KCTC 32187]|nr:hypothetical protein Z949_1108 [Sulfitobacter guttiformis KCTC 32187]